MIENARAPEAGQRVVGAGRIQPVARPAREVQAEAETSAPAIVFAVIGCLLLEWAAILLWKERLERTNYRPDTSYLPRIRDRNWTNHAFHSSELTDHDSGESESRRILSPGRQPDMSDNFFCPFGLPISSLSSRGCNELKTISPSTPRFCLTGADGEHHH